MTHSVKAAVEILNDAATDVHHSVYEPAWLQPWCERFLMHAIRHITRYERDVYPKVRGSRKGNPVTRGVR